MSRIKLQILLALLIGSSNFGEIAMARCAGRRLCRCRAICMPSPSVTSERTRRPEEIVTPLQTRHQIIPSSEADPDDLDELIEPEEAPGIPRAQRWDGSDGETFSGLSRRRAKTSVSDARMESFRSLFDLLNDLPDDDDMRDGDPDIERGANSGRVDVEDRNVTLRAFLYAASREADNDFHLIVGDGPMGSQRLMNVEVSGLPQPESDRDVLTDARGQFEALLNGNLPGTNYDFYRPPIPIRVSGSLFYDVDHPPGEVGPGSLRSRIRTSWEIHPITSIRAARN